MYIFNKFHVIYFFSHHLNKMEVTSPSLKEDKNLNLWHQWDLVTLMQRTLWISLHAKHNHVSVLTAEDSRKEIAILQMSYIKEGASRVPWCSWVDPIPTFGGLAKLQLQ
jgi:hypothetical protein